MKVDIDVRTKEEWDMGHKPGALHFDLERLLNGEVPDISKDTIVHVYCRSGARAGVACEVLKKQGFTEVHNSGGVTG